MDVAVDQAGAASLEPLRRPWPDVPAEVHRRRLDQQVARLYLQAGFVPTGVRSPRTYRGVGDDGVERTFTETSEPLVLPPGTAA